MPAVYARQALRAGLSRHEAFYSPAPPGRVMPDFDLIAVRVMEVNRNARAMRTPSRDGAFQQADAAFPDPLQEGSPLPFRIARQTWLSRLSGFGFRLRVPSFPCHISAGNRSMMVSAFTRTDGKGAFRFR